MIAEVVLCIDYFAVTGPFIVQSALRSAGASKVLSERLVGEMKPKPDCIPIGIGYQAPKGPILRLHINREKLESLLNDGYFVAASNDQIYTAEGFRKELAKHTLVGNN